MPMRYLNPGIRDSEAIDRLSAQAETMFYRLLVTVDDFGRYDARPAMLKDQCFPVKDSVSSLDCKAMLEELIYAELVVVREENGKYYLQMMIDKSLLGGLRN